jgi:hypothetical protein
LSFLSGKESDLGIEYTEADAVNFLQVNKVAALDTCPTTATCNPNQATYSGTQTVNTTLTNAEGTALINQWIKLSKNAPFSSAQMRVNSDGSVDFSGTIDMARVKNFAVASKVPENLTNTATKFVSALGNSFPITAHGTLTITKNKVNANFGSVKVGFISVPESIFTEQKATIDSFVEDRLTNVPSLSIEELSFKDGKTTFKGTLPKTIVYVK